MVKNIFFLVFLTINCILLVLFICDFYNNFNDSSPIVNTHIYEKYINILSSSKKINEYCVSLVSNETEKINENSAKNVYHENKKPLGLNICVNVINSSVKTQSLISAAYYNKEQADYELKKQIHYTKEKFANNKNFLNFYMNKLKSLESKSKNIVNEEYPNPFDGRETQIYITFLETNFLKIQSIILQGLVYEYCINNIKDKSCNEILINN